MKPASPRPLSCISLFFKTESCGKPVRTHLAEQDQVFLAELEALALALVDLWTACCPGGTACGSASLPRCHLHFPCRGGARPNCAYMFNLQPPFNSCFGQTEIRGYRVCLIESCRIQNSFRRTDCLWQFHTHRFSALPVSCASLSSVELGDLKA